MSEHPIISGIEALEIYGAHALILDDEALGKWFCEIAVGNLPADTPPRVILTRLQSAGVVVESPLRWELGNEGRKFAEKMGIMLVPSGTEHVLGVEDRSEDLFKYGR